MSFCAPSDHRMRHGLEEELALGFAMGTHAFFLLKKRLKVFSLVKSSFFLGRKVEAGRRDRGNSVTSVLA
jgi:hypothetical protein